MPVGSMFCFFLCCEYVIVMVLLWNWGKLQGDALEDKIILESIKYEPGRIEGLTVQELRTTLRLV